MSKHTPLAWALHYPRSSPTLLRNLVFTPDHSLLQYMPYNSGNGNIV